MSNTSDREVIGDFVELRFTNLPSSSFMRGKVDTGATICSLHCDGHKIDEEHKQITFNCRHLSENSITMALTDNQAVKTADNGTEYRPVIEMSVKVGDQVIENVKFNLNDRSDMDCPVLVGQNLIKAGNFLIDPKQVSESEEEIDAIDDVSELDIDDVSALEELPDEGESDTIDRSLQIEVIYQLMRSSDITFSEIINYSETQNADKAEEVTVPTEPTDTI